MGWRKLLSAVATVATAVVTEPQTAATARRTARSTTGGRCSTAISDSEAAPAPYDLVVLTRFDLQLKHPLLSLPGLRLDALNFVFSEARQLLQ